MEPNTDDASRASCGYAPKQTSSTVLIGRSDNNSPLNRTIRWIAPFHKHAYPGKRALFKSVLPRHLTWEAIGHWARGRTPVPSWAARAMADHLEARGTEALELARYWRDHADTKDALPPALYGFAKVDAEGRSSRANFRR